VLERFLTGFTADRDIGGVAGSGVTLGYLRQLGGTTFGGGLYRLHTDDSAQVARGWIDDYYGEAGRYEPFGFDWLGREFALDTQRLSGGRRQVMMLELGTGERLEIPANLEGFHEQELVDYADAALAASFFETWITSGGAAPAFDQCVGYKVPLFLGGADEIGNLEVTDRDVYWTVLAQLPRRSTG
jgi:hypothetical protein